MIYLLLLSLLAVVSASNEEGLAFLAANKEKPGVVELPSGLQYKVLTRGDGAYHPGPSTPCSCHYTGTLIDGTKFDSSVDRGEPTTFAPNQVIKGWTEAMQLMVEGDKWELYIPSELAYGERGSPPKIPAGAVLIFTLELIEIQGTDKVAAVKCDAKTKELCNDKETAYIDKVAEWEAVKITSELKRLRLMQAESGASIKPELLEWMQRRVKVLEQLATGGEEDAASEL